MKLEGLEMGGDYHVVKIQPETLAVPSLNHDLPIVTRTGEAHVVVGRNERLHHCSNSLRLQSSWNWA